MPTGGTLASYLTIADLRNEGILQEVNRRYLHPIGLALEVTIDPNGDQQKPADLKIWDYRKDPEGIVFSEPVDKEKARRFESFALAKWVARHRLLGFVIQAVHGGFNG
jgi:hypothetical protein